MKVKLLIREGELLESNQMDYRFYDLDDTVLYETNIGKGDVIVLFRGGHSLEVLDEG